MAQKRMILLTVIVRTVLCVLIVGGAFAVYGVLVRTRPEPARSDAGAAAPRVGVMTARAVEVRRQWNGYGTAKAMDTANVPSRVTATVVEIADGVLDGAWVEEGELLVRLDDSDFARQVEIAAQAAADIAAQLERMKIEEASWRERLEIAREQIALARAEFDRVVEAQRKGAAKEREVDQSKQALLAAMRDETVVREESDKLPAVRAGLEARRLGFEAERRLAEQNVERCRIVSPLTGVLQAVDVEVGEGLTAGQRVGRVVSLSAIEVPLRLPASARPQLRPGDEAALWRPGARDAQRRVRLARIAPVDDETTRTLVAYVEVEQDPHAPEGIAPGEFLRAAVTSSRAERRWVVPRRAMTGDRVLRVVDGRIVSRAVDVDFEVEAKFPELGLPDEQWVVLAGALDEGDMIVVNAARVLPDGLAVEAVASDDGSATARSGAGGAAP